VRAPRSKCPRCGRPLPALPSNPFRPFCSERCRLLDLGAWLGEQHAIPGEEALPDAAQPAADEAP